MTGNEQSILVPGETAWKVAGAERAAVLVDGADYYGALRKAILAARRSIIIVGWDVDSRTRLVGRDGEPDDDAPAELGPLLEHVVLERPQITVYILLWDYSILYALDREPFPAISLDWSTPSQVQVCLDDVVPLGASHHQKIAVIDDAVGFCGGLDLTIRRWDTSRHAADEPYRKDPAGKPYGPFHDVQMAMDGEAARALGELARERWLEANCLPAIPLAPTGDPWPEDLEPDFEDVRLGFARTVAPMNGSAGVREVEALYRRAIERAERRIYIENQFLSSTAIADCLVGRLEENPDLEVVVVCPHEHQGWLEDASMGLGRRRFRRRIDEAGVHDRVRVVSPMVPDGGGGTQPVMVHAKLMVVDDAYLHVGSANLNNRSMGLDSECDVGFEAGDDGESERIAAVRNRLLAEHLDATPEEVAASLRETGSLIATVDTLGSEHRGLEPIEETLEEETGEEPVAQVVGTIADPEHPVAPTDFVETIFGTDRGLIPPSQTAGGGRGSALWKLGGVGLGLMALALAWKFTPLSEWTSPERVMPVLERVADSDWRVLLVPGSFVIAGFALFPVTVLIAVTAAVFGPWEGLAYAVTGSLASAAASYGLGYVGGRRPLRALMGRRLNRVSRAIARKGIFAVATVRMVPVAPFTVVNVVAGASHIRFPDFLIGTLFGLAPGIVLLAVLGDRLRRLWEEPTAEGVAVLAVVVALWVGLGAGAQYLVRRRRDRDSEG